MKTFEIYFADLNTDAMERLCEAFNTTGRHENWETQPLVIIERDEDSEEEDEQALKTFTNCPEPFKRGPNV